MQVILGTIFHFIGGFASGSFYMPYKKVRGWAWETYWIVGGFFSWLIVPPLAAWLTIPNFWQIITGASTSTLLYTFIFGLLWGIGGLTYGLGVRYLGVSLGSSIILGLCMVFGSLIPSVYYQFFPQEGKDTISIIANSSWGLFVLAGLLVCIIGIILCGKAGTMKERQMKKDELKNKSGIGAGEPEGAMRSVPNATGDVTGNERFVSTTFEQVAVTPEAPPAIDCHGTPVDANTSIEFKLALGLTVAIISGVLSACFNFGIEAGKPMAELANMQWKTANVNLGEFLYQNNVIYVVLLWGGLSTNFIWCMILNARNKSFGNYSNTKTPLLKNYLLSALAGTMWFLQFFFYGMGESKMGNGASSWILHMSFIILVANFWGLVSNEWKGVNKKTMTTLFMGVGTIILAVLIVGYGNYLRP